MGGGEPGPALIPHLAVPVHTVQGNVHIKDIVSIIDDSFILFGNHGNIGNILPCFQYRGKLGHNPPVQVGISRRFFIQQVVLHIAAVSHHGGYVFHIINVGINVPGHLPGQAGGIIYGII